MFHTNRARCPASALPLCFLVLLLAACFAAGESSAQDNRTLMKEQGGSNSITWWVVGAGGILSSGNDRGDILSATVGQTAIDKASYAEAVDPRASTSAYFGFWLPQVSTSDDVGLTGLRTRAEGTFSLSNHPNPFPDRTTISYLLPDVGEVRLRIFDATGKPVRLLVDQAQPAGQHRIAWDARDDNGGTLATGAYFYTLEVGSLQQTTTARGVMYLIK